MTNRNLGLFPEGRPRRETLEMRLLYILKARKALKVRSDWLLEPRIFFAIHLQATLAEFAPENIVIIAGINELKSSLCVVFRIY